MLIDESNTPFGPNDLIIISDGSQLWTPQEDSATPQSIKIEWQAEVIAKLMQHLPQTTTPVLIGAPTINAEQLSSYMAGHAWENWGAQYAKAANLHVTHRFPDTDRENECFGSTDPDRTCVELWFLTEESFYTGARGRRSSGWLSSFRRLGFDVSTWDTWFSLAENLRANHARDLLTGPTRPSGIAVGELTRETLAIQRFELV